MPGKRGAIPYHRRPKQLGQNAPSLAFETIQNISAQANSPRGVTGSKECPASMTIITSPGLQGTLSSPLLWTSPNFQKEHPYHLPRCDTTVGTGTTLELLVL